MRKRALVALVLTEAITLLLGALFYLRGRPAIVAAFDAFATPRPTLTGIALAPTFLPAVGLGSVALFAVALLAPVRRSQQMNLAGAAVVLAGFGLVFAVIAALYPIFQPV